MAERLLHFSKERRKAEILGGLDPDVVETAGLAHDLGHPPFGHVAEKMLQAKGPEFGLTDGFEGNAQSFRIVASLAIRSARNPGLNLTRASLNAILKYPWVYRPHFKKWGAYLCDQQIFDWARKPLIKELGFDLGMRKTLEAAIMDFSDDIAYCVYDLEDFTKAGKIPLDRLFDGGPNLSHEAGKFIETLEERKRKEGDKKFNRKKFEKAFLRLKNVFPALPRYSGTNSERALFRDITSTLVGKFMNSVSIRMPKRDDEKQLLDIPEKIEAEVELLKALTFSYVVFDPSLANQQSGYRVIIQDLITKFCRSAEENELNGFPAWARELLDQSSNDPTGRSCPRTVMDFIASLTETQALHLHQRVMGMSAGNLFAAQF